jgi:DNA-binding SARP family transcriptional activator/tetratricopeptide (TPR) repeat protein
MIELRLLDGAGLRRADGSEVHSVLSQPKRFALLVYLALAGQGGFRRRDSLLALFWPEADQDRARGSLRTSLHFLRRSLGDDVIVTRGPDEVGIRADALVSDVGSIESAAREERWEAILAGYAGPLLPGFNLDDAPGWDDWLDAQRRRLDRVVADAAWTLADRARQAGRADEAGMLARRAVALAPYEEAPVRRLMSLLAELGDRSAALVEYQAFATRLAAELGAEPSSTTRDLAAALRAEDAATRRDDAPIPSVAPAAAAPLPPPVAPAPRPRRPRRGGWHPRRTAAAAGVALLLLAAAFTVRGGERAAAADAAAGSRLVVLPFSVRGTTQFDHLGEGMVDLLSTALDGAGALRTVDPRAVLGTASASGRDLAPADGRRIAAGFAARFYILGSVVANGERMRVAASLYDAWGTAEPVGNAAVEGPSTELFRLVDALTARLLMQHLRSPDERMDRVAVQTTPSLAALKLYLQGTHHLRMGHFDRAVEQFSGVLAEDSVFAMAAFHLSIAAEMAGHESLPGEAGRLALRHAGRLPPVERRLLEAWMARGDPPRAERIYREIVAAAPDRVEAWYQLADLLFHRAPARGEAFTEAESAFREVLRYEPRHAGALQHLARIAAADGRAAALDSFATRASAVGTGDVALEMDALRFLALRDGAAGARVMARLRETPDNRVWVTAWRGASYTGNYLDARELLRVLAEPARARDVRAFAHLGLAHLELASGRPGAAAEELDAAERLLPGSGLGLRVSWTHQPLAPGRCEADEGLGRAVSQARSFPPAPTSLATAGRYRARDAAFARRDFLLALLAACTGPGDEVERRAAALADAPSGGVDLGAMVVARAVLAGTLREPVDLRDRLLRFGDFDPDDADSRFLRAELSRRSGDAADAIRWYGSVQEDLNHFASVLVAPGRFRRAELLEEQGRRAEAAREYRRFGALWREAEPELRPLVEQALRRAAALER